MRGGKAALPQARNGQSFDWIRSILASVIAGIVLTAGAVAARNANQEPAVFLLTIGGATAGAIVWGLGKRLSRMVGALALVVALISPWVADSIDDEQRAAPPADAVSSKDETSESTTRHDGSTTSNADEGSSTSSATTTEPSSTSTPSTAAVPDLSNITAALVSVPEFAVLAPDRGWEEWSGFNNIPVIDPDNPELCGQAVSNAGLTYKSYRMATSVSGFLYAGSVLAAFRDPGAQDFYEELAHLASACPSWRVNENPGLTGVDKSIAITVPEGAGALINGVNTADVVIFLKGAVVGMVGADLKGRNEQAPGVRQLADILADRL